MDFAPSQTLFRDRLLDEAFDLRFNVPGHVIDQIRALRNQLFVGRIEAHLLCNLEKPACNLADYLRPVLRVVLEALRVNI
jgi:hypothetical protein